MSAEQLEIPIAATTAPTCQVPTMPADARACPECGSRRMDHNALELVSVEGWVDGDGQWISDFSRPMEITRV